MARISTDAKPLTDKEIERFIEIRDAGLLTSPDELFQGRLLATIDALRAELLRVRADIGLNEGDFEALWEAYALAADDTLDTNAQKVKRKLRSIVGIDALKAELTETRHRERLSIEVVCAYEAGQEAAAEALEIKRLIEAWPYGIGIYHSVLDAHWVIDNDRRDIIADSDSLLAALRAAEEKGWKAE